VVKVPDGGGVPGAGAAGGAGAVGTAGITLEAVIVVVGAIAGAVKVVTGGAVGTVIAVAVTEFTPIAGFACGVITEMGTPLSDALPVAFCAFALFMPITAVINSKLKISFFITICLL